MKRLLIGTLATLIGVFGLITTVTPSVSAAEDCPPYANSSNDNDDNDDSNFSFLGFPNWYRGLQCEGVNTDKMYVNVQASGIPTVIWTVALNALDILLRVVGIIAVVMILVGGFQYITNGGSADKISKAKTTLLQAVVGLAIAILASAIISFVMSALANGPTS